MADPRSLSPRSLPLYDPSPPDPDGWHAVRSPGGYEWWYFDAEDDAAQIQIVAVFYEGFVFHPGYLRRYYRYLKEPTHHAPPLPGEYPCAYLAVYEKGRVLAEFLEQVRPEEFSASREGPEVRIGRNVLSRSDDGSLHLRMTGSRRNAGDCHERVEGAGDISCELAFHPLLNGSAAPTLDFLSRKLSGADHRWVIANPLCRVQGEIRLSGAAEGARRVIPISGLGYHDHNYGSGPLGPGLRRWMRGRMLWSDGMFAFQYARPRRRRLGDELHGVRGDAAGIRNVPLTITRTDWSGRTALLVRYPTRLQLKTVEEVPAEITLQAPKVIDATPFYVRLNYDARFGDKNGQAFCEVGYPRRLTWPLVGRMIERSITGPRTQLNHNLEADVSRNEQSRGILFAATNHQRTMEAQ